METYNGYLIAIKTGKLYGTTPTLAYQVFTLKGKRIAHQEGCKTKESAMKAAKKHIDKLTKRTESK